MKISIISPFSFGYIDALVEELRQYSFVEVEFIQLDEINFKYSGFSERMKNFFMKAFLRKNLKKEHQEQYIREKIKEEPPSDFIMVIRPDKLKIETLLFLKEHTKQLVTYCFDSINHFPKKEERLPFFDKVYSYEKKDVAEYDLHFITNFIPVDKYEKEKGGEAVFNVSSYDERFGVLEAVARQLKEQNYPYNIIVRHKKGFSSNYIEIVEDYLSLSETRHFIEEAGILLDIQKSEQSGLSFRVFEALGSQKKLITTNADVQNYDFFNPDNILIIDKDKPVIPLEFLKKPYVEIPEKIVSKYRREAWIKTVFGIDKA